MKEKKTSHLKKLTLSCSTGILMLGSVVSAAHSNSFTVQKHLISSLKVPVIMASDTTKMISGVPLNPEDISPLLVGEKIPAVNLVDAAGKMFDLNKAISEKPSVLVFYRGGWCPFCSKELAGLQESQEELIKMGYQIMP